MFVKELSDMKVKEIGIKAIFECELSKPGFKVEWYKGDKPIRRDERYDLATEGAVHRLIVEKVDTQDAGEYRVEFQKLSSSAKLSVEGRCECI